MELNELLEELREAVACFDQWNIQLLTQEIIELVGLEEAAKIFEQFDLYLL